MKNNISHPYQIWLCHRPYYEEHYWKLTHNRKGFTRKVEAVRQYKQWVKLHNDVTVFELRKYNKDRVSYEISHTNISPEITRLRKFEMAILKEAYAEEGCFEEKTL